ncbi:hypothetical protein [Nitratireductor sp. ZSWI3]|uniref:hypothetical protein n=1 Tax=Nitratireductor sp. ZSWI3 TaxID=2966359 RepID=UPI00214F82B4|nr:hypothetical protein [Nitratireductor sp. ZSWI3]MCR4267085.1 hypothetical protein [Nitratireductor sp. ZSWI3]
MKKEEWHSQGKSTYPEKSKHLARPTSKNRASENIDVSSPMSNCDEAALWYAVNREVCTRPIVPTLRKQFCLTTLETIKVIQAADAIRAEAGR